MSIWDEMEATIIMVTHDIGEAVYLAAETASARSGRQGPFASGAAGGEPVEITNIYVSPDSDPAFELDTDSLPELPSVLPAWIAAPVLVVVLWSFRKLRQESGQATTNAFTPQARYKAHLHHAIWRGATLLAVLTLARPWLPL